MLECQEENIQDGRKTSTDVRCRDMSSEETLENKLEVAEVRMLRWINGVTKLDIIRNERIRGTAKVREISKKVQESRLKYGHVLGIEE